MPRTLSRAIILSCLLLLAAPLALAQTVRMAVTDVEGLESLQREWAPFRDQLEGLTGYEIELFPVSNRTAAAQLLVDYGLDPQQDISVIHTSEPIQWESLKRGDVAAVGMNYISDFMPLREQEAEFSPGDFKVIARGPDLPNDILVAGDHVDAEVIETLRTTFAEHGSALIEAVTAPGGENEKYRGMAFIPEVKDSDYDYIRSAYAAIGYPEYADFVGD